MSKTTAILTALVLAGSASVAAAAPGWSYDRSSDAERARFTRDTDRDRQWRDDWRSRRDDFGPRRYRTSWVALSEPLQLPRRGHEVLEVHDRGTFTQLRLSAEGGRARVDRVIVQFADGSRQIETPRRMLGDRDYLEIMLDGNNRRVDRIVVMGGSRGRHNLQVFGI